MEAWNENMAISELEKYIICQMQKLENGYYTMRRKRQLKDAKNFLILIHSTEYETAHNLKELKQRLIKQRNQYIQTIEDLQRFLPGKQLSIFEEPTEYTSSELNEIEHTIDYLTEQIHWLHKCLGICHNKEYFKY